MSDFYKVAKNIQHHLIPLLFLSWSLRINLNKRLLIMGKFRFNLQRSGKALLETPKDGMQNKSKCEGEMLSARVKDEAGREME